jgi:aflatoxin B1 aldehyde reductase
MTSKAAEMQMVLGTLTFGNQTDEKTADRMIEIFFKLGNRSIDTAFVYNDGEAEKMLGRLLSRYDREKLFLATKASPIVTGNLSPQTVRNQLDTSLGRLKTNYVDLFYLHIPDRSTPIRITLESCAQLHFEGKFKEFGLSNYAAWEVADIWHICHEEGWPVPSVYQGMYNSLTRDAENELFPCLRSLGLGFYVFNPLAGGFLTGKYHNRTKTPHSGRFKELPFYVDRYWKESYFEANEIIRVACELAGIPMAEASLRWLKWHSLLSVTSSDGIIIGASLLRHLEQNIKACSGPELPEVVVQAIDKAWELARPNCPSCAKPWPR